MCQMKKVQQRSTTVVSHEGYRQTIVKHRMKIVVLSVLKASARSDFSAACCNNPVVCCVLPYCPFYLLWKHKESFLYSFAAGYTSPLTLLFGFILFVSFQ